MKTGTALRLPLSRRRFLRRSAAAAALAFVSIRANSEAKVFRAAIIGHTGQGNYGHDHDLIFNGRDNVRVVAVADPDPGGRTRAATRVKAPQSYADFREMLEKEKPDLVCVAPRWTDQHHAMALAALRSGAHVYLEKPITQTLAEADELIDTARQKELRITVAHQMRLAPNIIAFERALKQGVIGELLEIRMHGKQDHRAGGEDLVVLGVHLFDLLRCFAGDPSWCAARVLQNGHEISLVDAHPATENIGPVAGDDVIAGFALPQGVYATFTSRAKNRERAGPWGMELVGTKGSVRILMEMIPRIYLCASTAWKPDGKTEKWSPWTDDPTLSFPDSERGFAAANRRVVDDWLAAIAEKREPVCNATAAMKALEMAMAVFAAGLARSRIALPMQDRRHPLTR